MPGSVFDWIGNRVVTARMKRLAATKTPHSEPATAQRTVPFERLARVIRAARIKAAIVAQHRAHQVLVAADARQQDALHAGTPTSPSRSRRDSPIAAAISARRTRLTDPKDDVESLDRGPAGANRFTQPAAQAIAIHGTRHGLASDDIADTAGIPLSRCGDQLQEVRVAADAKLETATGMRPRQTIGSERRLRVRLAQRPSDRQARAALGAASRQNLAASDRLHPSAKPVRARAFNFRRLISAFHDDNLCWRSGERGARDDARRARGKALH